MTREEAIETLRNTAWLGTDKKVGQVEEAIQIAITALQAQGDMISRQAAIDAVYKCANIFINNLPVMVDKADAYKALAELPSAQPEIIKCKDCKFYTPLNRETKSGICSLLTHQNFGDDWYCAGAERRTDDDRN